MKTTIFITISQICSQCHKRCCGGFALSDELTPRLRLGLIQRLAICKTNSNKGRSLMVKGLLQQIPCLFHNNYAFYALTSKNKLFCTDTSTYQAVKTALSKVPETSFWAIRKVLIINLWIYAKMLHRSPARSATRKQATATSAPAIWTTS